MSLLNCMYSPIIWFRSPSLKLPHNFSSSYISSMYFICPVPPPDNRTCLARIDSAAKKFLPFFPMTSSDASAELDRVYREDWGRIVATLIRLLGDFEVAEEAAQDAFAVAVSQWRATGVPESPRAWIVQTARHKAIDRLRRRSRLDDKLQELAATTPVSTADEPEADEIADDRLRLIFTCCHPALPQEAQVALTLRTLCGLETDEIARAFLVP